jgi:uncharacterized C2H2 Zn-finger protein
MFSFKRNRNKSESGNELIKCKECGMKFDNKDRLVIHNKKSPFRERRKKEGLRVFLGNHTKP